MIFAGKWRVSVCVVWLLATTSSSAPLARPHFLPGRTPGSTAHSGSSATPTSGAVSQCSYAWTSGRKSARPGWMLSSSCPLTARAASRYSRTVESLQRLRYMPSGPGLGCTVVAMSSRTGTIGRIDGNSRICRWSRPTATERSPVIRPSAGEPGAPQHPTSRFFSSALGAGTVRVVGTAAAAAAAGAGAASAAFLPVALHAAAARPATAAVSTSRRSGMGMGCLRIALLVVRAWCERLERSAVCGPPIDRRPRSCGACHRERDQPTSAHTTCGRGAESQLPWLVPLWATTPGAQLYGFAPSASFAPGDRIGTPVPLSEFWIGICAPGTLMLLPQTGDDVGVVQQVGVVEVQQVGPAVVVVPAVVVPVTAGVSAAATPPAENAPTTIVATTKLTFFTIG